MTDGDADLTIQPGRIRDKGPGAKRAQSLVAQVTRAARQAGHTGRGFGKASSGRSRSRFGRGRAATITASLRSPSRRVIVKARVVRHQGVRFRTASLGTHVAYLKRDGVTQDGGEARIFDEAGDESDGRAFAERCSDDRHHFRFIVSPEDAARLADIKGFTRDLMGQAERDLGTKLDWVAVDHWNTDNPHVHVLLRGVAGDGRDLVIARDYIAQGLRARAEGLVDLELGPRTEQEIRSGLEREVSAERWTGLDRALQAASDEGGGVLDLRPPRGGPDTDVRRLMVGRAQTLERLGLADRLGPASWSLKPGAEATLRELGHRGDIIKTMHRAMADLNAERAPADFAIHGDRPEPIVGRLAARGLDDELKGTAFAVIDGVDGRVHHIRFASFEATTDVQPGGIVELRRYTDAEGRARTALAPRSDLSIEAQVSATGATWLDRRLVERDKLPVAASGFGAEVTAALERRAEHLIAEGHARRQGQRIVFAADLIGTLRQRELDGAAAKLAAETGRPYRPAAEGDPVTGVYARRLDLASGRFAMLDDGLGFQLVPWKPALDARLGEKVSGVMLPGGGVEWSLGRKRGLSI
jgi:type IV secretory pathway VirD2 relaxase